MRSGVQYILIKPLGVMDPSLMIIQYDECAASIVSVIVYLLLPLLYFQCVLSKYEVLLWLPVW